MSSSKARVFITSEDTVFSSPNADHLPVIPSRKDIFIQDVHHPREASNVRWFSSTSPHLAYIARYPYFDNPLLQRLMCSFRSVPISCHGGWHFLDMDVQNKWFQLESFLLWLANVLLTAGRVNLVLGWEPKPVPSACGYRNRHAEDVFARRCAMKSRDAFVSLMALCSWSISVVGDVLTDKDLPLWVNYVLKADPSLPPSIIEDLSHSIIADFNIPRVGCIMDVVTTSDDDDSKRYVKCMVRADVPIWFYWGTVKKPIPDFDRALTIYRPNEAQIKDILNSRGAPGRRLEPLLPLMHPNLVAALSTFRSKENPTESIVEVTQSISYPKGSRQRPSEDWRSFFARMTSMNSKKEKEESHLQRQRRLAKVEHSKTGEAPGRKGATVFQWVQQDNGFRVRMPVSRASVQDLWEDYPPEQRRYDGFMDEWDICTEFDPEAHHPYDDMEVDLPDVGSIGTPPSAAHSAPVTSIFMQAPKPLDSTIWNQVDHSYQPEAESTNTRTSSLDSIVNLACYRYGLVRRSSYGVPPTLDWNTSVKALGFEGQDSINPDIKHVIQVLVGNLLEVAKGNVLHPPHSIWDLDPQGSAYLFQNINFPISPRVQESSIGMICRLESRNLHPTRNAPWRIIVQDFATAVECLRRGWGPHQVDIAFELYSRGVPFRTCIIVDHPLVLERPFVIGLGYRLSGYKPSKQDYATYESIRNKFLETPRARAALLKGGIIWRLAKDVVPESAVLSGPSSEVYTTGMQFVCDGRTLVDDELSEDELNLISGVYKVLTGKGTQDSHLSWWPKHSAWIKSGLDVGFWSETCEKWYQLRLERIRAGDAPLRSGQEWTQAIARLDMNAKKVTGANRYLAAQALAKV